MRLTAALPAAALAGSALALTGCVANDAGAEAIAVTSTDDACEIAVTETPSGNVTFSVTNSGSDVTEFYLLADDGLRVISEVENIGPGLTRDLLVQVSAGDYYTACKPGMVGDGITAAFTVTQGAEVTVSEDKAELLAAAEQQYESYVRDQVSTLLALTEEFAALYVAGEDDAARDAYASTRVHWERIEPVAEAFGDLDPLMDAREADLAEGEEWTGWHHIEKNLWPAKAEGGVYDLSQEEREYLAADLVANTQELYDRVTADDFAFEAFQIGNGAKELLDEVASGKVTGEEEYWSGTDLWDFQANVDGAWVAFEVLSPAAELSDADLVSDLEGRFEDLNALLAQYGSIESGFVAYDELTTDQVKELADAVDALAEPLSQLTAAAVA